MSDVDNLVGTYRGVAGMLQMHLADFSEADMLARPTPAANHAAWQIGHLIAATGNIINMVTPGAVPATPPEFAAKYNKENSKSDTGFDSKADLLKKFGDANEASVGWLQKLSDADKAKATPDKLKGFAATVGSLTQMMPVHVTMHIGQIQVIRRKLGKPVIF
jgi:hypothetical protein